MITSISSLGAFRQEKLKQVKTNFSFNTVMHDFWDIYESIRKYYPIGIVNESGLYLEYPGIKALQEKVTENIQDKANYQSRWIDFSGQISKALDLSVYATSSGFAPSFSSCVVLQKEQFGNCIHKKELHFSVSLVGDYYQIYGKDTTILLEDNPMKSFQGVNVVTASPFGEYKDAFLKVEAMIQERFTGHRIIPIKIGNTIIRGLQVAYMNKDNCTVNNALFNEQLGDFGIRGDRQYGLDCWQKK